MRCQPANSWLTFSETVVILPPLLWLAARCQSAFAIAGASISSSVVICATTFGMGRFGDGAVQIMDRVHGGQAIVITLMASTLVLTALFAGLKRSNELLRDKEAGFRRCSKACPLPSKQRIQRAASPIVTRRPSNCGVRGQSWAGIRGTVFTGCTIPTARRCRTMCSLAKCR